MAFNHKKSIAYMALKNNGQEPVLDLLSLLPFRPGGQDMPYMKMICKAGKTKETQRIKEKAPGKSHYRTAEKDQ